MRKRSLFLSAFFCSLTFTLSGQSSPALTVVFHPVFNNSPVSFDDTYYKTGSGDSIRFETLKFYISGIELLHNDLPVWKEEYSYHLADVANDSSLHLILQPPSNSSYNRIRFNLGVDSIANTSGAMGGDLDPTKGMYWTWQNGYINFKLEGQSNLCATRNHAFQFHLGGYQYPFNALQVISLALPEQEKADIEIDLGEFIRETDLAYVNQIMTPGQEAVQLSKKVSTSFHIQAK